MCPNEKRQPEPGHARCPHCMDRDDEIEASKDRRKSVDENAQPYGHHIGIRKGRAVRRVKCPTGIDAALHQSPKRKRTADPIDVKAQKVDAWKSEVLSPDH